MTFTVEPSDASETIEGAATSEQSAVGMVALRSGKSYVLKHESTRAGVSQPPHSVNDAGVIYTSADDMPSLEELLRREEVAFAVLEREVVAPAIHPIRKRSLEKRRARWPLVGAASAAGATTAVGWLAFVDAVDEGALNANPYTALSLALGGIVLIATLQTAVRSGTE